MKKKLFEGLDSPPGRTYVPPFIISCIAVYFIVVTTVMIEGLVHFWPTCEATNVTSNNDNNLTVTSVHPAFGNIEGETLVSIQGTGFTDITTVDFGNSPGINPKVNDSTHLRVSAPKANEENKNKLVDIVVNNNSTGKPPGKSRILANGFLYVDPNILLPKPLVNSITPISGPLIGGEAITINGSGFLNTTMVSFGGIPGTNIQAINDETLVVTPPTHGAGKVDVAVSANGIAIASESYTYSCWHISPFKLFGIIIFSGALGGCLHGMRSLVWYVMKSDLQNKYILKYLLLPFIGSTFSVMFFLIVSAGFYKVEGTENIIILIGLCAIVGMFSDEAAVKLKSIAESLLSKVTKPGIDTPPIIVTSIEPKSGKAETEVTILGGIFDEHPVVCFGGINAIVKTSNPKFILVTAPLYINKEDNTVDVLVINKNGQSICKSKAFTCIDDSCS